MNVSLSDIFSSFSHIVTYPLWSSNCLCVEKLLAIQKKGDKTSTSNNLRLFGVCIERLRISSHENLFISHPDDNAIYAVSLIKFNSFGMCLAVSDFCSKFLEINRTFFIMFENV